MLENNTKEQTERLGESRMETRRGEHFNKKGADNLLNASKRSVGIRINKYSYFDNMEITEKTLPYRRGFSFTN